MRALAACVRPPDGTAFRCNDTPGPLGPAILAVLAIALVVAAAVTLWLLANRNADRRQSAKPTSGEGTDSVPKP